MEEEKVNQAIGELLVKEKYKFLPVGLVGEIVRDFLEEQNKEGKFADEPAEQNAIDSEEFRRGVKPVNPYLPSWHQ